MQEDEISRRVLDQIRSGLAKLAEKAEAINQQTLASMIELARAEAETLLSESKP
jgi:hypothetical protein